MSMPKPTPLAKKRLAEKARINARVAVYATELGIPLPKFLDAAQWLLKRKCPYCQLGKLVLNRINELGKEKATEVLARILDAKAKKDLGTLVKIREELNAGN